MHNNKETLNLIGKVISNLLSTSKSLYLYPSGHPQITESIEQLWHTIFNFLNLRSKLILSFSDNEIFFENELLVEESLNYHDLIDLLVSKKINRISFFTGLTKEELVQFLTLLNSKTSFPADLRTSNIKHIEVKKLVSAQSSHIMSNVSAEFENNFEIYDQAISNIEDIFEQAHEEEPLALEKINAVVDWLLSNIVENGDSSLLALTTLKNHDEYTCRHSINVAILSVSLGSSIGLDKKHLAWLGAGALLHDIGKINTPKEIINKPGRLTADEWQVMKNHPIESTQILSGLPDLPKSALIVAFEHHISKNSSGYPTVPKTYKMHLFSRIVQIADTYDGLTSKRTYHEPYLPTAALNYMLFVSPNAFDQSLLKMFAHTIGVFPVGSVTRLNTNEIAIVIDENEDDLLNPKIKILDKGQGAQVFDLSLEPDRHIVALLDPDELSEDLSAELTAPSLK